MKRFTPPRKGDGDDSESEYSDSDSYTDSEDYTDSYTGSSYTSSEDSDYEEDETLQAIRNTERAKKLRAKFEEWEQTQVNETLFAWICS